MVLEVIAGCTAAVRGSITGTCVTGKRSVRPQSFSDALFVDEGISALPPAVDTPRKGRAWQNAED